MPPAAKPQPQAGILNRPPDHLLLAALRLNSGDAAAARVAVERLRDVIRRELHSQLDFTDPNQKGVASPETGELGFDSGYDRYHLTVTVGFAATAYDKLGVAEKPADLRPIDWPKLSDTPVNPDQGDLILQICTNSIYIAEHVIRRVQEECTDLQLIWVLPGSQRHTSRSGRVNRDEGRALIGFIDGTSNLDPRHEPSHYRLVFVDPDDRADIPPKQPDLPAGQPNPYGGTPEQLPTFPPDLNDSPGPEPAWTKNGTYMVVRASVIDMPRWDDESLGSQETTIGRRKVSGNPLHTAPDLPTSPIPEPDFSGDPDGNTTRLAAHIRKANPRGPGDELRRIFRRGYPLILPNEYGLKLGLAFVGFGRTITTQFEFMTRAWTANPNFPRPEAGVDLLRQFETVLGGGYYFVPPLERSREPWSWVVPN